MTEPKMLHLTMKFDRSSLLAVLYLNDKRIHVGSSREEVFKKAWWDPIAEAAGCKLEVDVSYFDSYEKPTIQVFKEEIDA